VPPRLRSAVFDRWRRQEHIVVLQARVSAGWRNLPHRSTLTHAAIAAANTRPEAMENSGFRESDSLQSLSSLGLARQ
jgi:hypothetical protein